MWALKVAAGSGVCDVDLDGYIKGKQREKKIANANHLRHSFFQ